MNTENPLSHKSRSLVLQSDGNKTLGLLRTSQTNRNRRKSLRFQVAKCKSHCYASGFAETIRWPQLGPFFVPACPPLTATNGDERLLTAFLCLNSTLRSLRTLERVEEISPQNPVNARISGQKKGLNWGRVKTTRKSQENRSVFWGAEKTITAFSRFQKQRFRDSRLPP